MKIRPNFKSLYPKIISALPFSLVAALIPLLITFFIYGLLAKFGREETAEDTGIIIAIYGISSIVIYLSSLIKKYLYVKNTYISSDGNGIEVYSLIIGKSKTIIPYLNLHTFEVSQGLVERILNLGTINISSRNSEEGYELGGFDYQQADSFVSGVGKDYGVKVKS
ncbi:MAG: PH domain-containing protein [Candidatus Shapirobacteria bacterium]|jgi:membrane protein YdbS with pleckstrin-like domain